jgi:hypothetical protein
MTEDLTVARLKALVRELGRLDAPAVDVLRPEIRTGDKLLLRDPFAGKAAATAGAKAQKRLQKEAIGAIVVEWGYDVPPGRVPDFLKFLNDFEENLLDARPKGVRYKGTYSVFSSTEKHTGQFRTVWAYRDFGDLDALSDEYEDGTQFSSWVKQLRSFADNSAGAARSQQIYVLASSSKLTDGVVASP